MPGPGKRSLHRCGIARLMHEGHIAGRRVMQPGGTRCGGCLKARDRRQVVIVDQNLFGGILSGTPQFED